MPDQQPEEVIIPIERGDSLVQTPANNRPPALSNPPENGQQAGVTSPSARTISESVPSTTTFVSPAVPEITSDTPDFPLAAQQQSSFASAQPGDSLSWRAAEYMMHDKSSIWYGGMVLGSVLIAGIVYLLNRDIVTAVIVLLSLMGLTYYSARKPREQAFAVSTDSVRVGSNYYALQDFRSFSITEDPSSISLVLVPLKRFMPAINISVPADYKDAVVDLVSKTLPHEQRKPDVIDNLMRRIRF